MDEAGRRVDIAPAPVMQSMAIEGSVGYKSWSHASFLFRKSADKHTKSYHLLGMTKLKILKYLKTREKIQNGFTETLRRQRRVCCRDIYDPYGEDTETWLELLEAIPLAGSCLAQISQQQVVLPRFIVHRPITVWMHSSWARFHWDEHILLYSSCTWFHWRGMWISFRLCFKPGMIVMYFDGSLDPIDVGLEKEVSPRAEIQKKASCCHPPLLFLPVWSENFGAWLCGCCAFGSQNEFIPLVYRVFCDALGFALSHCCVSGWRLVVLILHFWCLGGHALLWMSRNLGPFLLASGLWSSTGTERPSMGSCKMVTRLGERFLPTLVMLVAKPMVAFAFGMSASQ